MQTFIATTMLGDLFAVEAKDAIDAQIKAACVVNAEGSDDYVEDVYPDCFDISGSLEWR